VYLFMHLEHDYYNMFFLHLLYTEAGREHHLGAELMVRENLTLKRICKGTSRVMLSKF